ncbi:orotidine-5'-phosphate decarboxylase [Parafrigoribacterium humi]|uniref:orotidine-5'-phosphate decarboxylase n=1 Tax=Parafrigoribacterium humi TaxID=3144664 RepID=UPI0032EF6262
MTEGFGQRLAGAFDAYGQLCVGIDPHGFLLQSWNLPDDASGLREFGLRVVEAAAGRVGLVKPQVAFFERHGSAGYRALEEVLAAARAAGLLVIADAKRGDVGSTVEAYAQAWLTPGHALEVDALTMNAYLGVASLDAPVALAHSTGKGIFVLAATSNPEALELQHSTLAGGPAAGRTVAASIVDAVAGITASAGTDSDRLGSIGVVLGATVDLGDYGIDLARMTEGVATPILAPGFGHQGARYSELGDLYGAARGQVIVSASRSVLSAGSVGIADAISSQAKEVAQWRG